MKRFVGQDDDIGLFSYMKIIPTDFPILFWWYFRPFSAHVHAIVWAFKINLGEIRNYGIQNPYQMYRHLWVKIMHSWWGAKVSIWQNNKKTTFGHAFRFLDFHEFWLFWFESKCKMFLDASNFSKTQLRNSPKALKHTFFSVKVK